MPTATPSHPGPVPLGDVLADAYRHLARCAWLAREARRHGQPGWAAFWVTEAQALRHEMLADRA